MDSGTQEMIIFCEVKKKGHGGICGQYIWFVLYECPR